MTAPGDGQPRVRKCGTMPRHHLLESTSAAYRTARERTARKAQQDQRRWLDSRDARTSSMPRTVTIYHIPVVVHVVWNTSGQNISDAQINSQIAVLNADYRAANANLSILPSVFQSLVGDARVQFALATVDPNGNPTTGITRTSTATTSFSDDDNIKRTANGGINPWDATRYLNIWIAPSIDNGDILGYATFPGEPSATDGVVIAHEYFGTTGTATAPYNLGRTTTHEVGHYLNLEHIWGDDGTGCSGTDNVADTPNQAGENFGTPTFPHVTCSNGPNGDLFYNYMDYTDDATMCLFTTGQTVRMQSTLTGARTALVTAENVDDAHLPFVGTSAWVNGAQNPQPTYPSGLQEGDVVYLIAVSRPSTVAINILTGWTFVGSATGGGGTEGAGTGPTRVSVLKRTVPAGGLSGALPSGLFTGTNAAIVHLRGYRGASGAAGFSETFTSYSNTSASTTVGGTGGAGLSLATDDIVVAIIAGPDDTVTAYSVSDITASGATFGTLSESPAGTYATATGNDLSAIAVTRSITAGSSSSAPVVTATANASETSMGFLLRVRAGNAMSGAVSRSTTAAASATAFVGAPAAVSRATTAVVVASAGVFGGVTVATTSAATVAAKVEPGGFGETVSSVSATAEKTDPASASAPTFAVGSAVAFRAGHPDVGHVTTSQVEASAFLLVGVENEVTTAHATVTATERRPDFGTIRIGRLTLTESYTAVSEAWSGDGRTLTLSGQESTPPLTERDIDTLVDDLQNLQGMLVPVSFMWKQDRDGYYTVSSVSSELVNWGDTCITLDWKLGLVREGADGEVDIESRLSGPPTRTNTHDATGERWHAPPIGATSYWTGTTQPSTMIRPTTEGSITIYRGIPTNVNPRYDVPAASYMRGRARILDQGRERNGVQWKTTPGGWELSNGLVKASLRVLAGGSTALLPGPHTFPGQFVYPGTGVSGTVLRLESWGLTSIFIPGGGYGVSPYGVADYGEAYGTEKWSSRDWTLLLNGQAIGAPTACSVLRNDPECVSVRVLWSGAPAGRTTADLTLRRGSRLVETFIRTSFSSTLKVARAIPEAATAQPGYLRAASDDLDGNRYVLGSAGDYTADIIGGGISKSSTTSLDCAIGVEMAGAEAAQGDQAGQLYRQYLGACSEMTRAARR